MAIFAYSRVSTNDQTTTNEHLDIEKAGYAVDHWFADEEVSGKTPAYLRPSSKYC
jgi:putative DNA-invertase from lambdoid prophage Rac